MEFTLIIHWVIGKLGFSKALVVEILLTVYQNIRIAETFQKHLVDGLIHAFVVRIAFLKMNEQGAGPYHFSDDIGDDIVSDQ